jgi:DNA-binding FrmR family transcriptional regulator
MRLKEQTLLLSLLQSVEIRLGSVIEMAETENNCVKILYQLHVIQETMQNCAYLLAYYQLQESLEKACFDACPENRSKELENLADLFSYYQEFS